MPATIAHMSLAIQFSSKEPRTEGAPRPDYLSPLDSVSFREECA